MQKQLSMTLFLNTRERKTSEKQGKPGSIHHMSGCKVDVERWGGGGGGGAMFKYVHVHA